VALPISPNTQKAPINTVHTTKSYSRHDDSSATDDDVIGDVSDDVIGDVTVASGAGAVASDVVMFIVASLGSRGSLSNQSRLDSHHACLVSTRTAITASSTRRFRQRCITIYILLKGYRLEKVL